MESLQYSAQTLAGFYLWLNNISANERRCYMYTASSLILPIITHKLRMASILSMWLQYTDANKLHWRQEEQYHIKHRTHYLQK